MRIGFRHNDLRHGDSDSKVRLLPAGIASAIAVMGMLVAGAAPAPSGAGSSIYVSPSGDDANPGTQDKPIKTLAHARDVARTVGKRTADVTIYLTGGTYRLTEPLTLEAPDSGAAGHNIIYTAEQGQRPILSGAVQVTGWKLVDQARNLWSAPAPESLKNTRQLYVDGVRADRARGRSPVELTETPTGYTAGSDMLSHWRNPGDIEFVYTGGNALWSEKSEGLGPWTEPRCPVAKIEGSAITMAQPCWDNSTKRVMLPASSGFKRTANLVGPASIGKQPAYIENAYELLGTPGQWYFDRSERTIYYVPRPGEDLSKADVEVPVLEALVVGRGDAEHRVHNIVFSNVQFSYATWLFPSTGEGFSEIQANYMVTGPDGYATQGLCKNAPNGKCPFGDWTPTPGNIAFTYDRDIQFTNDVFTHLGAAGLQLGNGSQNDLVQGCVFTDISGNGIALGGVNLPEAKGPDATAGNKILNNHLYGLPAEYHGGVAIDVGYAQNTEIRHNQLDHLPYSGISMGWGGWPDKIKQPGVANTSQNNVVADNLIFDHLLLLADGGGIYTQGLTGPSLKDGEKVTGNVVRDQYSSGHAIYSDNGSANMTITGNVMFHTNFDNWGTAHANYYDGNNGKTKDWFDIQNNYWQQGTPDSSKDNVTLKDNHLIGSLDEVPAEIVKNAGLEPAYQHLLSEQVDKPAPPEPPARVAAYGTDRAALVTWSPPVREGGAKVDSYTILSNKGDRATISADDFMAKGYAEVPNISGDADYSFTVTATTANGTSVPSLPSAIVHTHATSASPPAAPRNARVFVENGKATIHFQAPESNGGAPITAYRLIAEGGPSQTLQGRIVLTLSGTHTIFGVLDGLDPAKSYTFEVAAINAAGQGEPAKAKGGKE